MTDIQAAEPGGSMGRGECLFAPKKCSPIYSECRIQQCSWSILKRFETDIAHRVILSQRISLPSLTTVYTCSRPTRGNLTYPRHLIADSGEKAAAA